MSRDSSVGIALGYGLDDRGSRVRFLAGAGNFSLHHRVQNVSGAHPASYPGGTTGSFPGGKTAGTWRWPLTSIYCRGQRMSGAIPPLPQHAFIAWCSVETQGKLYLYLLWRNIRKPRLLMAFITKAGRSVFIGSNGSVAFIAENKFTVVTSKLVFP
jgi:hypothetical protein